MPETVATVSIGADVRRRRRAVRWTRQQHLADAADVALDAVFRIESNKNVRTDTLAKVMKALEQRERELGIASLESAHKSAQLDRDLPRQPRTGPSPVDEAEEFDRDITRGYRKGDVPLIGDAEASTNGFIAWDEEGIVGAQVETFVSRSFADRDPRAYALRVRGDSMAPRYRPGEVVVAQPQLACRDGDDAVVVLKTGERLVKRAFRTSGGWVLHSENPAYPDRAVMDDEIVAMHRIRHRIQVT